MKSFNVQALRGHDYSDDQFKIDMMEHAGINIPDQLLYTPRLNDYVLNEQHKKSSQDLQEIVNPATSAKYTPDEAYEEASQLRSQAKKNIDLLMRA